VHDKPSGGAGRRRPFAPGLDRSRPRGGRQRIPRPADAVIDREAPWRALDPGDRRLSLAAVRARLADLPAARVARPLHPESRPAAVLIPVFEEAGEARVILTKRPETMPTHRGEIAFPGGRHDPVMDPDLRATALREAQEEVGLDPAAVEVVAELDGIATVGSRFTITPFVGFLDGRPRLAPHATEVVAVFDVTLSELLDPDAFHAEHWGFRDGLELHVHFYDLPGETVWGATARILTGLLAHLTLSGPAGGEPVA
jgi:8-oxo-dGTP pyrophosphatase MutT (NUDIX family)